jgi:C1A family cysteine protease
MRSSTFVSLCACALSAISFAPTMTTARPMHAGIDYERYLSEKEATQAEVDQWMKKHGAAAEERGFLPTSEERSTEDYDEDIRQRIFLSKLSVERAQAVNPGANFSTDTIYSVLTPDEFKTKILNSRAHGNATLTRQRSRSRKLRTEYDFTSTSKILNKLTSSIESQPEDGSEATVSLGDSEVAAKLPVTAMSFTSATRSPSFGQHGTPITDAPCDEDSESPEQSVPTTTPATTTKTPATKGPTTATPATTEGATINTQSDSVDWTTSPCISPVQNQGQCGDCWAFATASAVESAKCIAGGQQSLSKFSEQQLVSCNTQNNGCNGGAPQYAFDYILDNGLCSETGFPYVSSEGSVPSCTSCAKGDTGITGYNVLEVGDEAGLLDAINQRPTVVTVAAGNEAWKQYTGGVLSSCDTSDLDHLVVAVGYDGESLKIRNSWGETWGEDGYIRLKRAASGSGTCSVMEQMVPIEI